HHFDQRGRIHPRHRHVAADPVDGEQAEGEEHPPPEVRDREDVAEALDHEPCSSQRPPAASIFSRAVLEKASARTASLVVSSPPPSTLTFMPLRTMPWATRDSGVTSPSKPSSAPTLITVYSVRKMLVNPRFGTRRTSGIWPPSKPGREL